MPRRTSTRLTSSVTPRAPSVSFQLPASDADPNILQLRRHWKWAAFSQFFFTFNALFAMNDVTLIDIENDLAYSTNRVLSRIMTRLLVTLTQDRKTSVDNWQTALRKQYMRRDPDANPIGPIQQIYINVAESSRASTAPPHPSEIGEQLVLEEVKKSMVHEDGASADGDAVPDDSADAVEVKSEEAKIDESKDEVTGSSSETLQDSEQLQQQMDWLDLPTVKKLDSLHTLMEWQFHNPNRLRTQMKDDDENAEWHIEPIGYDAKSNAYWLIGADRLWIQREPPRQTLKRKRLTNPNASKSSGKKSFSKRQRVDPEPEPTPPPTTPARASRRRNQTQTQNFSPSGSRGTRAAKSRANQKLDAQAKDLAEFQRQMARSKSTNARPLTPRRPSGIRVSARLRGNLADDEWQEVPDEWLSPSVHDGTEGEEKTPKAKARLKTGLESDEDSVSDLTELSEDDDTDEGDTQEEAQEEADAEEDEEPNVKDEESEADSVPVPDKPNGKIDHEEDEELPSLPEGFIEWETICITLEEWDNFPEQFEKATHYAEKSLYKVLTQSIVPAITAELREVEKKKRKEEAVVHRKRSSRIAIKESEKEQELLAAKKRAEEDEKMGRARRAEARRQKEEADRIKRENAREQRRKEREAKQVGGPEADTSANTPIDVVSQEPSSSFIPPGQMGKFPTLSVPVPVNGSGAVSSGSRTPAEDWELDCEVCGRQGVNRDDGVPIMCCGRCLKWQHIGCHDQRDVTAGRPKRNWDAEDFICRRCRVSGSRASSFSSSQLPTPTDLKAVYGSVGTQPYYSSQQSYSHDRYPNGSYYAGGATSGRYSYEHQSDIRSSGMPSQSYTQAPRTSGVTFAHYQPQQGGFSTSRPSYSVQEPVPITQQTRYPQSTSPVTGVSQYPGSFQTHPSTHIQVQPQHRWQPSSYSRSDASYNMNAVVPPSPYTSQQQPYYPGTSSSSPSVPFSQMHGTNHQSVPQYPGYQHAAPYQQSR